MFFLSQYFIVLLTRVANSRHFNKDLDPAFHLNADPDPAFHLNVDPDQDPAPHQSDQTYRPPELPASIVSVPGLRGSILSLKSP
jgi:hypothetical protein